MRSFYAAWLAWFSVFVLLTSCTSPLATLPGLHHVIGRGFPPINYIMWSPTSPSQVLITANTLRPGKSEVYVLDITTKKKTSLARTRQGQIWGVTWLPDGTKALTFVSPGTEEFESGYWIAGADGASWEFFGDRGPVAWSPDGTKSLSYDQEGISGAARSQLHLIDLKTNKDEVIYVAPAGTRFHGLSLSGDSKNLVFSMGDEGLSELYVMDLETRTVTKISEGGIRDAPVWSPAGDIIAFQNSTSDDPQTSLHLIRSDGTCEFKIPSLKGVRSPTWTPDGKRLAFVGEGGLYYFDLEEFFGKEGDSISCFQVGS